MLGTVSSQWKALDDSERELWRERARLATATTQITEEPQVCQPRQGEMNEIIGTEPKPLSPSKFVFTVKRVRFGAGSVGPFLSDTTCPTCGDGFEDDNIVRFMRCGHAACVNCASAALLDPHAALAGACPHSGCAKQHIPFEIVLQRDEPTDTPAVLPESSLTQSVNAFFKDMITCRQCHAIYDPDVQSGCREPCLRCGRNLCSGCLGAGHAGSSLCAIDCSQRRAEVVEAVHKSLCEIIGPSQSC